MVCIVPIVHCSGLSADNAEHWGKTNAAMHSSEFDHVGLKGTYGRH